MGFLGHACLACPWHFLVRFISAFLALPGALDRLSTSWGNLPLWEISMTSLTAWYWPPCLDRACFLTFFIEFSWSTAWPNQCAWRTQQTWFYRHRGLFWCSERIHRSDLLLNSCPYYLWLEAVSGPAVAEIRRRIRDKVLVLAMTISHPSYLMFYWLLE